MVAKSYQNYKQIGEPFEANGRMYVVVQNPKDGSDKTVRWYTEKEYNKMYAATVQPVVEKKPWLKKSLGFEKGYITVFPEVAEDDERFLRSNARWHGTWGWYVVSTESIPTGLIDEQPQVTLYWKDVIVEEGVLKERNLIKAHISKLYAAKGSSSEYIGSIGERLELEVTITKIITTMSSYGPKVTYFMQDENGNTYKWFTSPRQWTKDTVKRIRGTVKNHLTEKNEKITTLTRCMEVK